MDHGISWLQILWDICLFVFLSVPKRDEVKEFRSQPGTKPIQEMLAHLKMAINLMAHIELLSKLIFKGKIPIRTKMKNENY